MEISSMQKRSRTGIPLILLVEITSIIFENNIFAKDSFWIFFDIVGLKWHFQLIIKYSMISALAFT